MSHREQSGNVTIGGIQAPMPESKKIDQLNIKIKEFVAELGEKDQLLILRDKQIEDLQKVLSETPASEEYETSLAEQDKLIKILETANAKASTEVETLKAQISDSGIRLKEAATLLKASDTKQKKLQAEIKKLKTQLTE